MATKINKAIKISQKHHISREKSPRYFRKLITSIQEKTGTQWHLYDDKQCVCVPEAPSCWQYKASTKL